MDETGDWHQQLLEALPLAEEESTDEAVRTTARQLLDLLREVDDCKHTVRVDRSCAGLDPEFVLACAQDTLNGVNGLDKLEVLRTGAIALTFTARGDSKHVAGLADLCLHEALRAARLQAETASN